MDEKLLSAHITIIADTLNHIDVILTFILIFLVILTVVTSIFLIAYLFTHIGGNYEDE